MDSQLTFAQSLDFSPVPIDQEQTKILGRLLLNSWCAEYALRITPIINNDEYLKTALDWSFPQAYYSAFFSARAVLLCSGLPSANENTITKAMAVMAGQGLYDAQGTNLYATLEPYRIAIHPSKTAEGPLALQKLLIERVQEIALIHERYILEAVGPDTYQNLIACLPDYLRTGFIQDRLTQFLIQPER